MPTAREIMDMTICRMFDKKYNPFLETLKIYTENNAEVIIANFILDGGMNLEGYAGRGDTFSSLIIWVRTSDIPVVTTNRTEFHIRDRVWYLGEHGIVKQDENATKLNLVQDPSSGDGIDIFGTTTSTKREEGW